MSTPSNEGTALPRGQEGAAVRLHPLIAGEFLAPRSFLLWPTSLLEIPRACADFRNSRRICMPVPAFLIEHPSAGLLLIDTGLSPHATRMPIAELGPVVGAIYSFFRLRVLPEQSVRRQIHERGLDPDEVETVVMTHLHLDHASGTADFPEASFVCSRDEWVAATGPSSLLRGYYKRRLPSAHRWRTLDFRAAGPDDSCIFEHAIDLFGDGSVVLLFTPGHSRGHISVRLQLRDRVALLAGDAANFKQEFVDPREPTRMPVPLFLFTHDDRRAARDTLARLKRFAAANPDALIVPGHDPEVLRALQAVYE